MTTYTSPRYISVADTAKLVREALKQAFPGIKFSVRSKSYAGGASIYVSYTDGPRSADVEKVTKPFEGASFDGSIDLKSYQSGTLNGETVHFGSDYVNVSRTHSLNLVTKVTEAYCTFEHCEMPPIEVSGRSAYIGWTASDRELRDEIMPLVYDCSEVELEGLTICISHGRLAIKRADTEDDREAYAKYTQEQQIAVEVQETSAEANTTNEPIPTNEPIATEMTEEAQSTTPEPGALTVGETVLITAGIYANEIATLVRLQEKYPIAHVRLQNDVMYSCPASMLVSMPLLDPPHKEVKAEAPVHMGNAPVQTITTCSPHIQKGEEVKQHVLDILKAGQVKDDLYYLPNVRLERKVYEEVNEVLSRIGGKWNRKAKAHVFEDTNPKELLDLVFESGEMPPKNPTAFFPTPPAVIDTLLSDVAFYRIPNHAQRILEPSAGKGSIARAIRHYCQLHHINAKIHCCEILPRFQQQLLADGFEVSCADFLDFTPPWLYDAIVMNPPFAVEGDPLTYITHIEHAWSLLAPHGVLLAVVPSGFAFRSDKRIQQFRVLVEMHGT